MQKFEESTFENKSIKPRRKVAIIVIAVLLSICTLSLGVVLAKYINIKNSTGEVIAAEFYFTSNLLDGKEHTLAPGATSVTFTLSNHADDLRFSDVDINYTVTVDNGATVENGTGTLAKGSVQDVEVTVSNLAVGTYTITVVGKGGFTKTLTATIVIPEHVYYKIDNTSADEYVLLTVWNEGDKNSTVTITYTGIPDNTNPNMEDWKTNGSVSSITINAHESKVFRFFGKKENVTITVTGANLKTN